MNNRNIIVIGGSTGATGALKQILVGLPADLPASIFIVTHMPPYSNDILSNVLNGVGPLPVSRADDGAAIERGHVYVAVPDHHLLIEDGRIRLGRGPRENMARPSIDPLFRSAALWHGPRAVGVILAGTLDDGASGLAAIKQCGGVVVVQDPCDAIADEMPASALRATEVDACVPVADMAALLAKFANEPAGTEVHCPPGIRVDVEIAAGGRIDGNRLREIGDPSPLTCPTCHRTLSEVHDKRPLRYRCQLGHAYTAAALEREQGDVDEALRVALGVIEERAELVRRMARDARETSRMVVAEMYDARSRDYVQYADAIRRAAIPALPPPATSSGIKQTPVEDLRTVNGELTLRVDELVKTNADLKTLLESTQIAAVVVDDDLRVKDFTPTVTDLFHLIDTDIGRPITHITGRIVYPDMQDDARKVLRTLGTIEREVEDSGTGARYLVRVLPYRSVDNFIAGVVLIFLDVTATARVERALRESEERFRMMAQTVPAFLFTARPDLEWDYVNVRFYEFTGLPDGAALGAGWLATLHPDDVEENQRRWHRSAETGTSFEMTYRLRGADGGYRWFLGRAEPMRGADGHIAKWFGSCTDIHERRLAEDRQRLLMGELQHRVKNVLATVRSLFSRTVETKDTIDGIAAHFQGRLDALARTQNVLARTTEGVDLEGLVCEELLSHGARAGDQINVRGPLVRLREKAAEALGLAVHELATNAAKYGALSRPTGRIGVTWRVYDGGGGQRLALEWRETGVRLIDPEPHRSGFGRELIERGLPYQLGATTALEFNRGGLRCAIELPLTERVALLHVPKGDNFSAVNQDESHDQA